jgi:hypothetical protein
MTAKFNRINATSETLGYESHTGGKDATDFHYTLKQDDKNPGDSKYTFKRIGDEPCAFEYTLKQKGENSEDCKCIFKRVGDEPCAFEYTMKQEHKVERSMSRCPYCGELIEYCTGYVRTTPDASSPYHVNTSWLGLIYGRVV